MFPALWEFQIRVYFCLAFPLSGSSSYRYQRWKHRCKWLLFWVEFGFSTLLPVVSSDSPAPSARHTPFHSTRFQLRVLPAVWVRASALLILKSLKTFSRRSEFITKERVFWLKEENRRRRELCLSCDLLSQVWLSLGSSRVQVWGSLGFQSDPGCSDHTGALNSVFFSYFFGQNNT